MTRSLELSRRGLLTGIVGAAALPMITGPVFAQAAAQRRGGTLAMVTWPAPTYLTSAIRTSNAETLICGKMFDGLLDYDVGYVPVPALAESWDISNGGLRITFNLRQGVKWHDGEPFTSRDVAVTMMEILKVHHGRGRATYANLTAVETPDDHTAVFVMSQPAPAMFKALNASESPILPAHLYAGTDILANEANTNPVGTGAFMLAEYTRGESLVMTRNPDYWSAGQPYIDQLTIRFVADPATRAAMLEAGEVDIAQTNILPLTEVLRLGALPQFEVTLRGYEVSSSMTLIDFNMRHPIVGDVKVRQAFAHLIDTAWITENIAHGFGVPATGPIHQDQSDFYTTEGVPSYPYDPARAEALLDEAGYPRQGGTRFELTIDPSPSGEQQLRVAEYVREQCRQIGITINIRTADSGGFASRVYTDRDFDMTVIAGSAGIDPTIGVQRFYWSKNIREGVPYSNGTGYSNPAVDALLEAAAVEIDPEARRQQYAEFQRLVMADVPTLPLVASRRGTIANVVVKDHTLRAIGLFGTLADVWLDR
jgi:peptide/nickel transport system substrate-binding protein